MKIKIIVLSIAGIIILFLLYLIMFSMDTDKSQIGKEIKLRSDIKEGYSMEEMLSSVPGNTRRNDYIPYNPNSGNQGDSNQGVDAANDAELKRIQAIIQENEQNVIQTVSNNSYLSDISTSSVGGVVPKNKKENTVKQDTVSDSTIEIEAVEPEVSKKRRNFNSTRLIKEDETNAIRAFVHSTQTVMVGSTLKMQLSENCLTDDGQRIRKGTPVYGEVTNINGERVIVKITSININNNILPFKKNVYSKDALEGIYVPGNPKSDVAKDAGAAAVQGSNANISGGFDLTTQLVAGAANSVMNATKSVAAKNIKNIKVTIKTNYQLLLMEDKR